ncbi:MAG: GGDEF domain-containing protein [Thiobacillus sp.]|nr:GGDEF domain-containing protein [Thiobacillus sp.]
MPGQIQDPTRYELSPVTGEFRDLATEVAFREYIHPSWVRDTRRAFVMAALFYLAFAFTDYLLLGASTEYEILLLTRLVVAGFGLLVAFTAERYWRLLVDGITPTLVLGLAMAGYLSITLLRPLEAGWHAMGMMVMLLGTYAFIPNRFLPIMTIALSSTVAFFILLADHFELPFNQMLVMGLLFLGMNVFGAYSAYRISRLIRENFRDAQILRQANQRLTEEVAARKQLELELLAQVHHDDLTGVTNRRRFHEVMRQRMRQAETTGRPMSLMLLDVDYFKQINDTYGHQRGDEVLKALVRVCQDHMGEGEILARVGGEEFALLMPDLDLETACQLAEQIRSAVWRSPVSMADLAIHVAVSIGVVQWDAAEGQAAFLGRADQALQAAKYNGRNRVETHPPAAPQSPLSTAAPRRENA